MDKSEYNKRYRETHKEEIKALQKAYREKNKEKLREYKKKYYTNNKEKCYSKSRESKEKNKDKTKKYNKVYAQKNREKIREHKKKWRDSNPEYAKTYSKKRSESDPSFKLKKNIRKLIWQNITKNSYIKNKITEEILGCTAEEFRTYIENKFEPWMTWDNYGLYNGTENYGWDIDHIIPQSSAKDEKGVIALNHYTNLQPLCSYKNRVIKRANL